MHLVTNINEIRSLYRENHTVKVRVFGSVQDFNPREGTITIQSINLFTERQQDLGSLELRLDPDISINNPEITYIGTVVDVYGLYNGEYVMLLDVKFPDSRSFIDGESIEVMKQMSDLKPL